jgi:hypothetical protein
VRRAVLASWALVLAASHAGADPHNYVQAGLGDFLVVCDNPSLGLPGLGGVCIPGGHVRPDASGDAVLTISDLLRSPVSGLYCQDQDGSGVCGDDADPFIHFCNSLLIESGLDWTPALPIQVRIDGPVFGSPLLSPCGSLLPSLGTIGSVSHT